VASGPFYLSLPPRLKPLVTPVIIAMQNKKCKKEDILTILNVLGDYLISHQNIEDVGYSKKSTYGSPT